MDTISNLHNIGVEIPKTTADIAGAIEKIKEKRKAFEGMTEEDNRHAREGSDGVEMHVVEYVGTYIRELEAIQELREGGLNNGLLLDVASPRGREAGFWGDGAETCFDEEVPSNAPQRAIVKGLSASVECIQGPPGTGKSTTIFHILSARLPPEYRALVTCVQNEAVDSIVEKLAHSIDRLPFVVHGKPARLGDCAVRFTAPAQAARDPKVVRLGALQRTAVACCHLLARRLLAVMERRCKDGKRGKKHWHAWWTAHVRVETHAALVDDVQRYFFRADDLHRQAEAEKGKAHARIVAGARAFIGTVDSLYSLEMGNDKFAVIIDEAGTVPEYKMPLLINMGAAAIVAIGDQKQLQPFTHAPGRPMDGFFQRAVRAIGNVLMLSIQYRMHPDIARIVSDLFYDRRLTTDPGVVKTCGRLPGPALQWLDYPGTSEESDDAKKRCNKREVEEVSRFMHSKKLKDLLDQGKTVSIITFYKHQLRLLMEKAVDAGFARTEQEMRALNAKKKDGSRLEARRQLLLALRRLRLDLVLDVQQFETGRTAKYSWTPKSLHLLLIEIAQSDQEQARSATRFKHPNFRIVTVDAAQGSEADFVVISCVRCNPHRDIGFVSDPNRACVALSRAKECLLIVGSADTMSGDRRWKRVRQDAGPATGTQAGLGAGRGGAGGGDGENASDGTCAAEAWKEKEALDEAGKEKEAQIRKEAVASAEALKKSAQEEARQLQKETDKTRKEAEAEAKILKKMAQEEAEKTLKETAASAEALKKANSHTESCAEHHDVKSWGVDQVIAFFERCKFPTEGVQAGEVDGESLVKLYQDPDAESLFTTPAPDGLGFNKLMFKGRFKKEMEKLVSK
jgi:hypothetical protein